MQIASYHAESLGKCADKFREKVPSNWRAGEAGIGDRVRFEVARAKEFTGRDYDLVTFFDSLHDMGDPVSGAALGAQAGEARLREVVLGGGFTVSAARRRHRSI